LLPTPIPLIVQPPAADVSPPRASVAAVSQRLGRNVAATIGCPDEACRVTASATVRIPKVGRAKAKSHTLASRSQALAQGTTATVRLALTPSLRAAIRRTLRGGGRVSVTLRVRVADDAGNTRNVTRQFRLLR